MNRLTRRLTAEDLVANHWSPQQALAIHEFLESLTEAVWNRYEQQLLPLILDQHQIDAHEQEMSKLPDTFPDDDIPF